MGGIARFLPACLHFIAEQSALIWKQVSTAFMFYPEDQLVRPVVTAQKRQFFITPGGTEECNRQLVMIPT